MPPDRLIDDLNKELMELAGGADEFTMKVKEMPDAASMHSAAFILNAVSNLLDQYAERWDDGDYDD